jgi:prepilin-type processing-associated H-X9-DG protein
VGLPSHPAGDSGRGQSEFRSAPVRHGDGTDFSFADGHSEYWKWGDQRTIEYGKMMPGSDPAQPGNPDLHRTQQAVWGKLGYTPTP